MANDDEPDAVAPTGASDRHPAPSDTGPSGSRSLGDREQVPGGPGPVPVDGDPVDGVREQEAPAAGEPVADESVAAAPGQPAGEGDPQVDAAPAPPAPPAPRDPNVEAVARAGLAAPTDEWLRQVAAQVDPRLDRCAPGWRSSAQSGAARACVFGLMLGRLANDYPHTSGDLGRVAETHPSFATLGAGSRLATLREIAQDPGRGAAWVAPLVGVEDATPLRRLLD